MLFADDNTIEGLMVVLRRLTARVGNDPPALFGC